MKSFLEVEHTVLNFLVFLRQQRYFYDYEDYNYILYCNTQLLQSRSLQVSRETIVLENSAWFCFCQVKVLWKKRIWDIFIPNTANHIASLKSKKAASAFFLLNWHNIPWKIPFFHTRLKWAWNMSSWFYCLYILQKVDQEDYFWLTVQNFILVLIW